MTGRGLRIEVRGTPAPQGSKTRTRYGMRDDNAHLLKPWREAVKHAAIDALRTTEAIPYYPRGVAVVVEVTFYLPRPAAHYGTGRNAGTLRERAPDWPVGKPDVDKLARAVGDAFTDAGVWADDCQVVAWRADKSYVVRAVMPVPGAVIRVVRCE